MKASSVRFTNSEKQFVGKSIESGIVRITFLLKILLFDRLLFMFIFTLFELVYFLAFGWKTSI